MAFNPFNWFRKQQKVIIAALAVLCMIIFVFQFGPGDLFQQTLGSFGRNRQSGDLVTTLHGKKVYTSDLEKLAAQRRLASDFLFHAAYSSHPQVLKELLEGPLKPSAEPGSMSLATGVAQNSQARWATRFLQPPPGMDPRIGLRQVLGLFADMEERGSAAVLASLREDLQRLEGLAAQTDVKDKPERLAVIDRLTTILAFQTWLVCRQQGDLIRVNSRPPQPPEEYYFGGSRKVDDLLDFMVLRKQAEKLKIDYTDEGVMRLVTAEAAGHKLFDGTRFAREKVVTEFLSGGTATRNFTAPELMAALREELRVAAAAERLLLGYAAVALPPVSDAGRLADDRDRNRPGHDFIPSTAGVRAARGMLWSAGVVAAPAPEEFLRYYREQTTSLRVSLLPVPASAFLDQVKGSPTEEELRARYDRYRREEPRPGGREPGFREPRRVAISGVVIDPASPEFLRRGRQARLAGQALAPLGAGPLEAALMVTFADPLTEEYGKRYLGVAPSWLQLAPPPRPMTLPGMPREPRTDKQIQLGALLDPHVLGQAVLGMAQSRGGLMQLPAAVGTWYSRAGVMQTMHAQALLSTAMLGLAEPQTLLSSVTLLAARHPRPVPLDVMRPMLVAQLDQEMALATARKVVDRLRNELTLSPQAWAKERMDKVTDAVAHPLATGTLPIDTAELARLMAELEGRRGLSTEAWAKARIAREADKFGWRPFGMKAPLSALELHDMLDRGEASGLEPAVEAHYRELAEQRRRFDEDMDPGMREFGTRPPAPSSATFVNRLLMGARGLYRPEGIDMSLYMGDPSGDLVVYWLTEEKPGRERSFAEARAAVEASWRLEKARQLAQARAEAIEKQINAGERPVAEAVKLLHAHPSLGEPFTLDEVAPMVQPREALARLTGNYKPFELPEAARARFRYPPADLARQLQVLRRPGDATVVSDLPTDTWYVAVLESRTVPTILQFRDAYERGPVFDPLFGRLLANRSRELRQQLLAQLRREAGEVESGGRFKVPAAVRERDSGRIEE